MNTHLRKFLRTFNNSRGFFMFVRAQLSAQVATFVDFALSIILHQLVGVYYVHATFYGSVTGGLVNCAINYKWTFHTADCHPLSVLVKYVMVWLGSISLNIWGTYLLTETLTGRVGLFSLSESLAFIIAKVVVAVTVAVLWNYNLHRSFVFKDAHVARLLKKGKNKLTQYGNKTTSEEDPRRSSATHLQDHQSAGAWHDTPGRDA